jgi:hypothetical protein
LIDAKVCSDFNQKFANDTVEVLYTRHLSALQVFFLSFFFYAFDYCLTLRFFFFFVRSKFLLLKRNNVKSTMIIFNISIFLSY